MTTEYNFFVEINTLVVYRIITARGTSVLLEINEYYYDRKKTDSLWNNFNVIQRTRPNSETEKHII